jgi:ribosomal protein S18 acetylase RimI-like enzyme
MESGRYQLKPTVAADMQSAELYFRPLNPEDREQVQQLHEDWFPVRYESAFYDKLVRCGPDHSPYFTMAAVLIEPPTVPKSDVGPRETLIGIVSANVVDQTNCDEKELLAYSLWNQRLAYILTLGVAKEYRRNGTALRLLATLVDYLETAQPTCHVMYLHCLSTNCTALRFYERAYFIHIRLSINFYFFGDARHDAVTVARYINGGRRPWAIADVATLPRTLLSGMWRGVSGFATAGRRFVWGDTGTNAANTSRVPASRWPDAHSQVHSARPTSLHLYTIKIDPA